MKERVKKAFSSIVAFALALSFTPVGAAFADEPQADTNDEVVVAAEPQAQATVESTEPVAETAVSLAETAATTETSQLTAVIENIPEGGKLFIVQLDQGVEVNFENATAFKAVIPASEGENVVDFEDARLTEGKQVAAIVLDSNFNQVACSEALIVTGAGTEEPTGEIIDNCSVTIEKEGGFQVTDTGAPISYVLDPRVESAYLIVVAYPGNVGFDPESSANVRLFNKQVSGSGTVDATFNSNVELKVGYKVAAYLHVAVDETGDYYKQAVSEPIEIVDENGQGFVDYTYPDASIVETELPVGATSLHINLTGDERIFDLAKQTAGTGIDKDISVTVSVAMHPDGDDFDFESADQVPLYMESGVLDAFSDKEIQLSQPLREGYRVRAVVYWQQDIDHFLPKGNDYEAMFNRPDDSVLVTKDAAPVVQDPKATIDGVVTAESTQVAFTLANLPENALAFVKAFAPDEEVAYGNGENLAVFSPYNGSAPAEGANVAEIAAQEPGTRIAVFVLAAGQVVAQSDPVTVAAAASGDISIVGDTVMSDATELSVNIDMDIPEGAMLAIRGFNGDSFNWADASQTVGFLSSPVQGENTVSLNNAGGIQSKFVVAFLMKDAGATVFAQSEPVAVTRAAVAPTVSFSEFQGDITAGDSNVYFDLGFDKDLVTASWTLYQFQGESLDTATAEVLASRDSVYSTGNTMAHVLGKLKAGSNLQVVVATSDGQTAYSQVVEVGPRPAWGTPYVAFDVSAVKADATTIPVVIDYADEYLSLSEFYCDVSIYEFPGSYTDEDFEDQELHENTSVSHVVAKANSLNGQETRGSLELNVFDSRLPMTPGDRLIIKLRLPHAEWVDTDGIPEVDYLSWSVPIVAADATIAPEMVALYNLDPDTSKGEKMHVICERLGLQVVDLTNDDLGQLVGYIAQRDGFEAATEPYEGAGYDVEYMLLANLSEASLDRLLDAMSEEGVQVGAKGITTDRNLNWTLERLIGNIADEDESFRAMLDMYNALADAEEALENPDLGTPEDREALQKAIDEAYATEESEEELTAEEYRSHTQALEEAYSAVTGLVKVDGQVAIEAVPAEDGTYTLTASVVGASHEIPYTYVWDDDVEGAVREGVPASQLGVRKAYAASDKGFGYVEGQLSIPATLKDLKAQAAGDTLTVTWAAPQSEFNVPDSASYTVELLKDGVVAKTVVVDAAEGTAKAEFSGLAKGDYTVKAFATNIVGRSDKVSVQAHVPGKAATPENGWAKQDGVWYYFKNGAKATGWQKVGSSWYLLDSESGAMLKGWHKVKGTWYWMADSGKMATGWKSIKGSYYYFKSNGAMKTGWLNDGGTWYYLKDSGKMATGWQKVGNDWYYFAGSGAMKTGWLKVGGSWYYLKSSGKMATGSQVINGKTYYFASNGVWRG
ncbi:N-acetylmuramoyl-L-alanine amidase family protein [Slackia heliotrinireducens]|uniref:N-acetylmuramoyl-L-alanine amidase family protein n=1 Tax=Slackia heliotrinireducens TaxID=84110 RepID=UPI003315F6F0